MAGKIGDVFGWTKNPVYDALASNRNALMNFGAGLASGNSWSDGLAKGFGAVPLGAVADNAYAVDQEKKAQEQETLNKTTEWLRQNGQTQLLAAVESGAMAPGDAFAAALAPPKDNSFTLGAGETRYGPNGEIIAQGAADQSKAPSGYQIGPDGTMSFIPGGPADPANMGKTTEAQRRNQQLASVIQPELATVDANWDELASGSNQAANATPFGLGMGMTSPGYQKASQAISTIAQSYLYSVSGAAAPAEEVSKLVDSVTPKPFESPASIAEKKRRIQQMANAVVIAGGGGQAQPAAPAAQNYVFNPATGQLEPQ